ncbi:MAG: tetratricopeptide repeat protein [Candidatus Xenobium sp.]|nr:tetratricopeptide repeat protein [Burkholderiales bacterium]
MKFIRSFVVFMLLVSMSAWAAPPKDLLTRAFEAYQKKEYQQAVELLEKHLEARPDDPDGHYAMGLSLNELGRYAESLEHIRQCIDQRPDMKPARASYATVVQHRSNELVNEGLLDEALTLVNDAVAFLPEEAGTHFARGAVLFERWRQNEDNNERLEAFESWKRCRELQPVSATGEILAGIAAFDSHDYKRARERFQVARIMRPNNRYAAMWLGLAEAALGNHEEALEQLHEARQMFARNPSLHRYIADIYAMQGHLDEAEKEYRAALAIKPGDARVHASLGELARRSGRTEMAAEEYSLAVQARPNSYPYRFRLGTILREAGRPDQAVQEFLKCRDLPGISPLDRAEANMERALILLEQGNRAAATEAFPEHEEALVRVNRNPRYLLYRAYIGRSHEQRLQAIRQTLDYSGPEAMELHSAAFVAWADLEVSRNRRLQALEMLHQAWLRTAPDSARVAWLRERFEETRSEDIKRTEKQLATLGPLALIDPIKFSERSGYFSRCLEVLQTIQLGTPGELLGQAPGSQPVVRTLVPAELDRNLARDVQTTVGPDAWMTQPPSWEQR